jgi:MATE family multidrug resistance protein
MNNVEQSAPSPRLITHRAVLRIAVPMMFAYLSTALVGAVSTAAIGRMGVADLSAGIAIAAVLFDVLFVSLNFLRSTTLGLTALALGAGRPEEARGVIQRALLLAIGLGLVILALRGLEVRALLPLLGAQGAALQAARRYVLIRALSAPFALGNYAILGSLLGRGRATAGLGLQLILNGTNILLCVGAVLRLHLGVVGVASAAVGGELTAFAAGLGWLRLTGGPLFAGVAGAVRDRARWRATWVLNRDTLVRSLALLFAFAFFTREGASLGIAMLAANAIHLQFFALASNCLDGFAAAAEQLAGKMIGAGNVAGFRRAVALTFGWSVVSGAVITLLYAVFGDDFIALMTQATRVRQAASASVLWAALVPLVAAPAFQLDGVFIGATWSHDMRNMMLISLVVFVGCWAVLMPVLGNAGLWLAFLIFLAVRGMTLGQVLWARQRGGRVLELRN